jgi:OmpA family
MADRLRPPRLQTNAARKMRLIDFETGKATLQPEHASWLDETLKFLPPTREFWIDLFGYSSKLGFRGGQDSKSLNQTLSFERASEVVRYLERRNNLVTPRVRRFLARGDEESKGPAGDDSPEERAVEVHIYLAETPPPPPLGVQEEEPCPGGKRNMKWSIATPFGVSFSPLPGAVVAGNVVVFRRDETPVVHRTYLSPGAGAGYSYSGPSLSKIKEIIKGLLGSMSYSGMAFTSVTADTPFNFKDLSGASCQIISAGAGVGIGYQKARLDVSGKVWFKQSNGKCMLATRGFVTDVDTSGKDLQLGVGVSAVGGPLVELS